MRTRKTVTDRKVPLATQEHNCGDNTVVESRRAIILVDRGDDVASVAAKNRSIKKECHAVVMSNAGSSRLLQIPMLY